jgi:hypothetical protein
MIMMKLKKSLVHGLLFVVLLASYACGGQYNTIEQEDPNEADTYVYGEIGGPPRQAKNQYEPNAEADARAAAIREKLFGTAGQSEQGN